MAVRARHVQRAILGFGVGGSEEEIVGNGGVGGAEGGEGHLKVGEGVCTGEVEDVVDVVGGEVRKCRGYHLLG